MYATESNEGVQELVFEDYCNDGHPCVETKNDYLTDDFYKESGYTYFCLENGRWGDGGSSFDDKNEYEIIIKNVDFKNKKVIYLDGSTKTFEELSSYILELEAAISLYCLDTKDKDEKCNYFIDSYNADCAGVKVENSDVCPTKEFMEKYSDTVYCAKYYKYNIEDEMSLIDNCLSMLVYDGEKASYWFISCSDGSQEQTEYLDIPISNGPIDGTPKIYEFEGPHTEYTYYVYANGDYINLTQHEYMTYYTFDSDKIYHLSGHKLVEMLKSKGISPNNIFCSPSQSAYNTVGFGCDANYYNEDAESIYFHTNASYWMLNVFGTETNYSATGTYSAVLDKMNFNISLSGDKTIKLQNYIYDSGIDESEYLDLTYFSSKKEIEDLFAKPTTLYDGSVITVDTSKLITYLDANGYTTILDKPVSEMGSDASRYGVSLVNILKCVEYDDALYQNVYNFNLGVNTSNHFEIGFSYYEEGGRGSNGNAIVFSTTATTLRAALSENDKLVFEVTSVNCNHCGGKYLFNNNRESEEVDFVILTNPEIIESGKTLKINLAKWLEHVEAKVPGISEKKMGTFSSTSGSEGGISLVKIFDTLGSSSDAIKFSFVLDGSQFHVPSTSVAIEARTNQTLAQYIEEIGNEIVMTLTSDFIVKPYGFYVTSNSGGFGFNQSEVYNAVFGQDEFLIRSWSGNYVYGFEVPGDFIEVL